MRCPACGHDNSDLATRCSACGAELPHEAAPAPASGEAAPPADETGAGPQHMRPKAPDEADDDLEDEVAPDEAAQATRPPERDTARRPLVRDPGQDDDAYEYWDDGLEDDDFDRQVPSRPEVLRRQKVTTFVSGHQRTLGVVCALVVVAALAVAWLLLSLASTPKPSEIQDDFAAHVPTLAYAGGTYGVDGEAGLSTFTVTGLEVTKTPDGVEAASGVGPSAYLCQADAVYQDDHVRAVRKLSATYVRSDDGWRLTGEVEELSVSLEPRSGVDPEKVLANMDSVLEAASADAGEDLSEVYGGGTFEVVNEQFEPATATDAATDALAISCRRDVGFYSYGGGINVLFAFESGQWQIRVTATDESATSRSYAALVGTWSGPVIDHEATGSPCYGAEDYPLSIVIESIGETVGEQTQVTGTLYALVHAHGQLERKQMSNAGDTYVEMVPFTGTLTSAYDEHSGSDLTLEATCELDLEATGLGDVSDEDEDDEEDVSDEDDRGNGSARRPGTDSGPDDDRSTSRDGDGSLEVTFVMRFGTDADPSSVTCELTSSYSYDEVLFLVVSRQTQARFTDTYQLTHS